MRMVSHVTMSLFINVLTGKLVTKINANNKLNWAEMISSELVPKSLKISLKVHLHGLSRNSTQETFDSQLVVILEFSQLAAIHLFENFLGDIKNIYSSIYFFFIIPSQFLHSEDWFPKCIKSGREIYANNTLQGRNMGLLIRPDQGGEGSRLLISANFFLAIYQYTFSKKC